VVDVVDAVDITDAHKTMIAGLNPELKKQNCRINFYVN
jgi:hypothetical protein